MNTINMPGFTAELSLVRQIYRERSAPDSGTRNSLALSNTVIPQWVRLTCPNQFLQTVCSAPFAVAEAHCAWLGWFNHAAEVACATGFMDAGFLPCASCSVT